MGVNNFTYSGAGLAFTEECEGEKLAAYQDSVGVWTIGYGHTGPDVRPGLRITQADAAAHLQKDILGAAHCVNSLVNVPLTQSQFDALVDFVFNLGAGTFSNSSMLKFLNNGDFEAAAGQFELFDHAGGKVVAGLLLRRQGERKLFLST